MIVLDASAVVEALVGREVDSRLLDALSEELAAPHLLDVEVLSALRGLELGRRLAPGAAAEALADYGALSVHRFDHTALAERVWGLRHRLTAYDATYVALAEGLDATLVTCDAKLAAPGHDARVQVVGAWH